MRLSENFYPQKMLHQTVISMWNNGAPVEKIASETTAGREYVWNILKKFEEELNRPLVAGQPIVTEVPVDTALEFLDRGWSPLQIALLYNGGKDSIDKTVKNCCIDLNRKRPLTLPVPYDTIKRILSTGTTPAIQAKELGVDLINYVIALNREDRANGIAIADTCKARLPKRGPETCQKVHISDSPLALDLPVRDMVVLRGRGWSLAKIATVMGCSVGVVNNRLAAYSRSVKKDFVTKGQLTMPYPTQSIELLKKGGHTVLSHAKASNTPVWKVLEEMNARERKASNESTDTAD